MINLFKDIFREYQSLVTEADKKFQGLQKNYGGQIKCAIKCSDCCHSVFGLFLVEAAYLNHEFGRLDRRKKREALQRGEKADRDLSAIEKKIGACSDPDAQAMAMARERVRCPLLEDGGKCLLYPARPLTCRVYGIPTVINGKVRACWKAGFEVGKHYPAYDLDSAYRELYGLSQKMLAGLGRKDSEQAALLVSVAMAIKTPAEDLLKPIYRSF